MIRASAISTALCRLVPTVAVLAVPAAAQNVIVVDDDGGAGVDYTDLQTAVDAAGADDVILVKDGFYGPIAIDGKSARLYGENDPGPFSGTLVNRFEIRNIAADQVVILNGLSIPESGSVIALAIEDCAGTVWIDDVQARVAGPFSAGLTATNAAAVVVAGCSIKNADPVGAEGVVIPGGPGAALVDSTVHFYDCEVTGGTMFNNSPGHAGLSLSGSFAFASGSSFTGGQGGRGTEGFPPDCSGLNGEQGGPGVSATSSSEVVLLDSQTIGGPGGPYGADACFFGPPGPAQALSPGSTVTDLGLTFPARSYDLTNPAISGQPATLSYTGTPGELTWGVFSINEDPLYSPTLSGSLGLGAPLIFVYFGTVPAGGTLNVPVNVTLPPGKPYLIAYEQGLFFSLEDEFVLGTPRASLILGSAP